MSNALCVSPHITFWAHNPFFRDFSHLIDACISNGVDVVYLHIFLLSFNYFPFNRFSLFRMRFIFAAAFFRLRKLFPTHIFCLFNLMRYARYFILHLKAFFQSFIFINFDDARCEHASGFYWEHCVWCACKRHSSI